MPNDNLTLTVFRKLIADPAKLNIKEVDAFLKKLVATNKIRDFLRCEDDNGNNVLHLAVMTGSFELCELFINKFFAHMEELVSKVNDDGGTPLLYAGKVHDEKEKAKIKKLLLPLALKFSKKNLKPLTALLNIDSYVKQYPEALKDKRLNDNLKLACQVINACRGDIWFSDTHPVKNDLSKEQKVEVENLFYSVRKAKNQKEFSYASLASLIIRSHFANCSEYSFLGAYYLHLISKQEPHRVEICTLKEGGHQFIVLDREKASDITDPSTWGAQAVLIDAWSGEAYPANKVPSMLKSYMSYQYDADTSYNLLASYNPNFHDIKTGGDCSLNEKFTFSSLKKYTKDQLAKFEEQCLN